MTVHYVGLSVQLHGLNAETADSVAERVRVALLAAGFGDRFVEDVDVTVDEHAGVEG